jgi:Zn-dependent protease
MFFIENLFQDPLAYLVTLFILAFGIVLHNVFQALLANYLGDPSAKQRGFTSTSNPSIHLSNFSWLWLAVIGFVSPNPIPVRLYNRQYVKEAMIWLFGPLIMLIWAFIILMVTAAVIQISGVNSDLGSLISGLFRGAIYSLSLGVMYLFPIPPLDGFKALFAVGSPRIKTSLSALERLMSQIPFSFMFIFIILSRTGVLEFFYNPIYALMLGGLQLFGLSLR